MTDFRLRLIDELELSIRTCNVLKNAGLSTVGDIIARSDQQLLRLPNMGRRGLGEVVELLAAMGLKLTPHRRNHDPAEAAVIRHILTWCPDPIPIDLVEKARELIGIVRAS